MITFTIGLLTGIVVTLIIKKQTKTETNAQRLPDPKGNPTIRP